MLKPFIAIVALSLMTLSAAFAAEEKYEFETDHQRQMFLELSQELRCPKCQNQNIHDSNALIANDMKRKVHQLLNEGSDKGEVIDFMKDRYGDFVHYKPPVTPVTMWLYLGPALFIVLTIAYLYLTRRKKAEVGGANIVEDTPVSDTENAEKLKKAEAALKDVE